MAYNKHMLLAAGLSTALLGACSPSAQFAQFAEPILAAMPDAEMPEDLMVADADLADTGDVQLLSYAPSTPAADPGRAEIDLLISKYADLYNVPAPLVHAVVRRESTYNPAARNGKHWGLMQINYNTAKTMGYRGTPSGLLDADTNLKYGVKYLAGAYLVADGDAARANKFYQTGYYYHAKRKGLLKETGLRP